MACGSPKTINQSKPMNTDLFAQEIIQLKEADLDLRSKLVKAGKLSNGYNPEMETLHIQNAKKLNSIIERIGYPTPEKVGQEASDAAWIIIQHAISLPRFMKRCATLLKKAVEENEIDPKNLAYLTDRIAMFEGTKQLYGTQFDWDENGEMSPYSYDDLSEVNERRRSLGLNSVQEQTAVMRKRINEENQHPPNDLLERKLEYDKWRKKVGWIK